MTVLSTTTPGMLSVTNIRNKKTGEANFTGGGQVAITFHGEENGIQISEALFKKWYVITDDARTDEQKAAYPASKIAHTMVDGTMISPTDDAKAEKEQAKAEAKAKKEAEKAAKAAEKAAQAPTPEEIAAKEAEKAAAEQAKAEAKAKKEAEKAEAKAKKEAEKAEALAKKEAEKAAKAAEKAEAKAKKEAEKAAKAAEKANKTPKEQKALPYDETTEFYTKHVEQGRDENYKLATFTGTTADWTMVWETKNNVYWSHKITINGDKISSKDYGTKTKIQALLKEKLGIDVVFGTIY